MAKAKIETCDVVIYKIEGRIIDTIAGSELPREGNRGSAEARLTTVMPRLNDHYNAAIVPHGKYKVGDKLK